MSRRSRAARRQIAPFQHSISPAQPQVTRNSLLLQVLFQHFNPEVPIVAGPGVAAEGDLLLHTLATALDEFKKRNGKVT